MVLTSSIFCVRSQSSFLGKMAVSLDITSLHYSIQQGSSYYNEFLYLLHRNVQQHIARSLDPEKLPRDPNLIRFAQHALLSSMDTQSRVRPGKLTHRRIDAHSHIDVIWNVKRPHLDIRDERVLHWMKVLGMGERRLGVMRVDIHLVHSWMRRRGVRRHWGSDSASRNTLESCMIKRHRDMTLVHWVVHPRAIVRHSTGG